MSLTIDFTLDFIMQQGVAAEKYRGFPRWGPDALVILRCQILAHPVVFSDPVHAASVRIEALYLVGPGGGLGLSFENQSLNIPPTHSLAASKTGSQIEL